MKLALFPKRHVPWPRKLSCGFRRNPPKPLTCMWYVSLPFVFVVAYASEDSKSAASDHTTTSDMTEED